MQTVIFILSIIGFFLCLYIMYKTEHGIPGIKKYDANFRLLDMRFNYDVKTVYSTFENIGENGMKAYKRYLFFDYTFILFFLILMIVISIKIADNNVLKYILIIFSILRAFFDIIENTLIIILINYYPEKNNFNAKICSWSTTLKFIFLYSWITVITFSLLLNLLE